MKTLPIAALTGIMLSATCAHAGVVVGGTRLLYDGAKKEASLTVNNPDKSPYLIQSWVDSIDGSTAKAPFVITPPLFRLDGQQQNALRIVRAGALPDDKESMYWLNVKSIPSGNRQGNTLQIAVRTRIKLIYRPSALNQSSPEKQSDKLVWSHSGNKLQVKNPSNYYINFAEISVNGKPLNNVTWVAPQGQATFTLPANGGSNLSWKILNDYGSAGPEHKSSI